MDSHPGKHPCPDCRQCQWCTDDRCRLCLMSSEGCRKKLSMAEQIALYEELNRPASESDDGCAGEAPPGAAGRRPPRP